MGQPFYEQLEYVTEGNISIRLPEFMSKELLQSAISLFRVPLWQETYTLLDP